MKENNFRFRETFGKLVEEMTDKQAGEFIKGISGFVFNGKPLESKDEYLKGVYLYVRSELETEARNKKNGKIGGAITAERCKEKRKKIMSEKQPVCESNIVSQLIIVSDAVDNTVKNAKPVMPKQGPNAFQKQT